MISRALASLARLCASFSVGGIAGLAFFEFASLPELERFYIGCLIGIPAAIWAFARAVMVWREQ